MRKPVTFTHRSVIEAYDELQVPALFVPWAMDMADRISDWKGLEVLDLATGTGVVTRVLASRVGPEGRIVGTDISEEMLERARGGCAGTEAPVEFVLSPAAPLDLPDASFDVVVCQQGFQFFPDRAAAAAEILRVLRPGGSVVVTTWSSLKECEYFCRVRDALQAVEEETLAEKIRVPFDFLPADELAGHFSTAGFEDVKVEKRHLPLAFDGGLEQAVATVFSTVAGQGITAMSEDARTRFLKDFEKRLFGVTCDGFTMGRNAANVLTAVKR